MSKKIAEIQESIAAALNKLPGVFSTVQWGGRAYKLPGPGGGGDKRKPKLLAHTWIDDGGQSVGISFKLDRKRAAAVVDQFDWITPHSFRTLAPSGWVTAQVRRLSQAKQLIQLLKESRALHPVETPGIHPPRNRKRDPETDRAIQRLNAVVSEKKAAGWSPNQDDDFED